MVNRILSFLPTSGQEPTSPPALYAERYAVTSDARLTAAGIGRLADGMRQQIARSGLSESDKQRGLDAVDDAYRASMSLHRWAVAISNEGSAK